MENNHKLKRISIKKSNVLFFDDIIKFEVFDNILIDEKSYKNVLVYNIKIK